MKNRYNQFKVRAEQDPSPSHYSWFVYSRVYANGSLGVQQVAALITKAPTRITKSETNTMIPAGTAVLTLG